MPAPFNNLSHEVVDATFRLVPRKSLSSVSLVCRSWNSISLPLLHHSVDLRTGDRADRFIRRVLQEPDVADGAGDSGDKDQSEGRGNDAKGQIPSRLTSCVRRISIVPPNEEDLASLVAALSKLENLEHLHLDTRSMGDHVWHDVLVSLHESLPRWYSLSLVWTGEEFPLGDSDEVVALTNIRELAIKFVESDDLDFDEDEDDGAEQDSVTPEMIIDFIRGASNIETLNLSFEEGGEWPKSTCKWSDLFSDSALSRAEFPNLRALRSNGRHLIPVDFYDNDSTFRRFLQNHPNLHTVELDTRCDVDCLVLLAPQITMTPEGIVGLMPSVQHFEGPCVLVEALLKSSLAPRLQTLVINQSHPGMLGNFKDLLPVMGGLGTPLPRLKRLDIHSDTVACDDILIGLSDFVAEMPQLEELVVDGDLPRIREPSGRVVYAPVSWVSVPGIIPLDIEKCLEPLRHLPHLRILTLSFVPGVTLQDKTSKTDHSFLFRVAAVCPRLKSVQQCEMYSKDVDKRCDIVRSDGAPVDVVHMRRHIRELPFGWDDEDCFEVCQ